MLSHDLGRDTCMSSILGAYQAHQLAPGHGTSDITEFMVPDSAGGQSKFCCCVASQVG